MADLQITFAMIALKAGRKPSLSQSMDLGRVFKKMNSMVNGADEMVFEAAPCITDEDTLESVLTKIEPICQRISIDVTDIDGYRYRYAMEDGDEKFEKQPGATVYLSMGENLLLAQLLEEAAENPDVDRESLTRLTKSLKELTERALEF